MNYHFILSGAFALGLIACSPKGAQTPEKAPEVSPANLSQEITFKASDGETVYADMLMASRGDLPLIILFHQAASNGRGEYSAIIPKLQAKNYNLLIVDQRSGGGHYGSENRTVKARGSKTTYCPAYADMEGALSYAKAKNPDGTIFAWGSSYSAALVLKLASEHGEDLAGVLSFSPATGGPMGECNANNFIAGVNIPALGLRPDSEMGKGGQAQRKLYDAQGLDYFVAIDGVHGSSMLDASRAKGDTAPTWKAVWAFLDTHK